MSGNNNYNTATPRRRNGLSRPYSGAQISAWAALLVSFLQFPCFVAPLLPLGAAVPITVTFVALVVLSAYYGFLTQVVDPMDRYLKQALDGSHAFAGNHAVGATEEQQRTNVRNNAGGLSDKLYAFFNPKEPSEPSAAPTNVGNGAHAAEEDGDRTTTTEPMKQCWICDVQVAEHSMHCKFCNKCVSHFDHHCMWLNTCIGEGNYWFFFRTMLALMALETAHFAVQLGVLVAGWTGDGGATRERMYFAPGAIRAILIFFMCFNLGSISLIGQLIFFHLRLQREKLTTYQYIVQDHKRRRELGARLLELENERTQKMAQAYDTGHTMMAWHLRCGRWCRHANCAVLDPLQLPPPTPEPDFEAGFANSLGGGGNNGNYATSTENGSRVASPSSPSAATTASAASQNGRGALSTQSKASRTSAGSPKSMKATSSASPSSPLSTKSPESRDSSKNGGVTFISAKDVATKTSNTRNSEPVAANDQPGTQDDNNDEDNEDDTSASRQTGLPSRINVSDNDTAANSALTGAVSAEDDDISALVASTKVGARPEPDESAQEETGNGEELTEKSPSTLSGQ